MKVRAYLGVFIDVDDKLFEKTPIATLEGAVRRGNFEISGDSYVPESSTNEEEINFYPFG